MAEQQRFVLVTGCGKGGIGEALVKEYASRGFHVLATILPTEDRDHLTSDRITVVSLDFAVEDNVAALKTHIAQIVGKERLEVLVNNAGIGMFFRGHVQNLMNLAYTMTAIDTDIHEVRRMFEVNVFGPMLMIHHFHDLLIASGGTIVNVGSIGGIVPYVYGASYNASKAALQHWSNTLRVEMAPLGVKVLTMISGEVGTNILKRDATRELPSNSYYSPLAAQFKRHVQRVPDTTDRFVYAQNVVEKSLTKSPPALFWFGKATLSVRLITALFWHTIWDAIFWRMFGLGHLHEVMKNKRRY